MTARPGPERGGSRRDRPSRHGYPTNGVTEKTHSTFYVLPDSPIKEIKDIAGKTIAVNTLGAHLDFIVREALHSVDLPSDAANLVAVPGPQLEQVLRSNQVDVTAFGYWQNTFEGAALENGELRPVFTDYQLTGEIAGGFAVLRRDWVEAHPEQAREFVKQSYALYPHLTVVENMGYSLRIAGKPKAEIRTAVEEVAGMLELPALLDRKPRALSGGQRQRVAIGRAILRRPLLFLLDEPLSNLDAELRVTMRVEIAKLHRRLGATMIYVTHDQVEAMTLADRLVLMRAGLIEQQGRPLDLYSDPDNSFVAGFLGNPRMNFLSGTITDHRPGGVAVALSDAAQPVVIPVSETSARQLAEVEIGIRPDWFTLADDGEIELVV